MILAEYLHMDLKKFNYYEYQMIKLLDFNLHINHNIFERGKII